MSHWDSERKKSEKRLVARQLSSSCFSTLNEANPLLSILSIDYLIWHIGTQARLTLSKKRNENS